MAGMGRRRRFPPEPRPPLRELLADAAMADMAVWLDTEGWGRTPPWCRWVWVRVRVWPGWGGEGEQQCVGCGGMVMGGAMGRWVMVVQGGGGVWSLGVVGGGGLGWGAAERVRGWVHVARKG
jgi:hypothetical protein